MAKPYCCCCWWTPPLAVLLLVGVALLGGDLYLDGASAAHRRWYASLLLMLYGYSLPVVLLYAVAAVLGGWRRNRQGLRRSAQGAAVITALCLVVAEMIWGDFYVEWALVAGVSLVAAVVGALMALFLPAPPSAAAGADKKDDS